MEDPTVLGGMMWRALDGLCVGFVTVNAAGRIIWMNRTAQRTLGLDHKDVQGKAFTRVVRDPQISAFWHEALESDQTTMGEICMHWPRRLELKINATASFDPSGELIGRALMFCDVTAERTVQVNLSREATQRLMDMAEHWNESAEAKAGLTAQELKILRMVGGGLSNSQIGQQMNVAVSTVRSHLKHVYSKLGLASRSEAISYALRNGLG